MIRIIIFNSICAMQFLIYFSTSAVFNTVFNTAFFRRIKTRCKDLSRAAPPKAARLPAEFQEQSGSRRALGILPG